MIELVIYSIVIIVHVLHHDIVNFFIWFNVVDVYVFVAALRPILVDIVLLEGTLVILSSFHRINDVTVSHFIARCRILISERVS